MARQIIDIELDMFQRVKSAERSLCQEKPEAFKVMREMTHSVLSIRTLESYLDDLKRAAACGRNLLTEKYARMENLIPPLNTNPVIREIVRIEAMWMKALSERFPQSFQQSPAAFERYLSSELETYSDRTLELYLKDILPAEKEGSNLAEKRCTVLARKLGYESIGHMEKEISMRRLNPS
jgi:hypothetical protein